MKRSGGPVDLEREAEQVFPAVCEMACEHGVGRVSGAALAAAYVVAWTAVGGRLGLVCGRRERAVLEDEGLVPETALETLRRLLALVGGRTYLAREGLATPS